MTEPLRNPVIRVHRKPKMMGIGAVLESLRVDFPQLTLSKIRYLEAEGLVSPERTATGYRRFSEADLARLRYVLSEQQNNFLPLRVIKEHLDAMDEGTLTALVNASEASPMISPTSFLPADEDHLTDADLAKQAKADMGLVGRLLKAGVIKPDSSGYFNADDVKIVTAVVALSEFGLDERHVKSVKTSASRQAGIIALAAKASSWGAGDNAQARAQDSAMQLSSLVVSLHATMVKNMLRDEFGD